MAAPQEQTQRPSVDLIAGSTWSELRAAGVPDERNMRSASALVNSKYNAAVMQAHEEYLNAGASWILTSNRDLVPGNGFTENEVGRYTQIAGQLAHLARQKAKREETARVLGGLPPLMPGYRSDRIVDTREGHRLYSLIGGALLPYVDAFIAEGMSSLEEALMAYEAVKSIDKPVILSFKLTSQGHLLNGEDVVKAVRSVLKKIESDSTRYLLEAITFNCAQPEDISKALQHLEKATDVMDSLKTRKVRLGGFADRISDTSRAGAIEEKLVPGATRSELDKQVFHSFFQNWINHGATIVGGCCGIPPSYYRYARDEMVNEHGVAP